MNAIEARNIASSAISKMPETEAIEKLIETHAALGDSFCIYQNENLPDRVVKHFSSKGFDFYYDKFTFNWTISW